MLTQSLLPTLSIGIFDHLDHAGGSLCQQYSDRLEIASACDHGTPHGLAASPNLFLSAVAQRTRKLRLGPLVMLLNLYHPLRVFEKICMLDQLSGGQPGSSPLTPSWCCRWRYRSLSHLKSLAELNWRQAQSSGIWRRS